MANSEEYEKELDSGFTLVQRKNMRRGKQQQQIYRPGSGPLRKSNTLEESESDTNILINSRQNQSKGALPVDDLRYKSEGNSPRDKIAVDNITRLEDISLNKDRDRDMSRRVKKPEQTFYVPRSSAQAREGGTSQDSNRNSYSHTNGNEKSFDQKDRFNSSRSRNYHDRKQMDREVPQREWREKSPALNRQRQGSEPRGNNDSGWHRTRDTRSVEPSGPAGRNYSSKIQSKPPSGRRHSTVGIERYKPPNLENLPPRFQKLYLPENQVQHNPAPEENWDGSSLTFQGHNNTFKNPSFHQVDGGFNPGASSYHNQNLGYNSLPTKPRGRGRLLQDYDVHPGPAYHSMTPEGMRSPCNSRPPTPPMVDRRRNDSRPQTPVNVANDYHDRGWYNRPIPEEKIGEVEANKHSRDDFDNRRGYGGQRNDYGRDGKNYSRDRYNRRDDDMRERAPHKRDRETKKQRDTPNRKDRVAHNRDNRRGGGSFNDRRRNNRRDRERRSRSREYNVGGSNADRVSFEEDDWNRNGDVKDETPIKGGFNESLERQLSPVSPVEKQQPEVQALQHIIDTTLDWSEEVELNDKLEAENLSDALTRSSSVTSLQEISTKSLPPNINATTPSSNKKSKRKNRTRSRNRSGQRDDSHSRNNGNHPRQNSIASIDSRDNFKIPQEPLFSKRRNSRDRRENSYERYHGSSRNQSRDCSWDRHHNQSAGTDNWREEIVRSRQNSESYNRSDFEEIKNVDVHTKKAGVIVLPQHKVESTPPHTFSATDHPRYPETRRSPGQLQKSLFDPNNPNKPIIVKSSSTRIAVPGFSDNNAETAPPEMYTTDQFGNPRPSWYDEQTDEFKSCHYPDLLRDVKRADNELQHIINNGLLLVNWCAVDQLRQFLKEALEYLLSKNIRFSQAENVEQYFWKILYHNIIEVTRKAIKDDPDNKEKYKGFLLYLIDEGTKYFERLLGLLETTYDFRLANFLGENNTVSHKGLGLVGLALVCAQKLFLFLGDLGRYREEVNETSNYGKCRQWYIKSHEINPKNGKPYNQLALLAVYAKRKLDAVYYYMRSLMSSNPVPSARENLISLFDENRKKYEQGEKKRREERLERRRRQMKQKESDGPIISGSSLRKEIWIHPVGGRRVHRTTQASVEQNSDEEDLAGLSSVEVNKRFVISYLHVHSKLITKIGMETFQETAMQMLREFRTLMQHSPVPLPCNRFLQLLALNMFAIENTQLRDPQLQSQPGYRSELQERALVVSLQMFDLILERCVAVLREHVERRDASASTTPDHLPADADVLLPAIKVWCDWMLGHANVWNPPPSTRDFNVGTPGDAWCRLAILMNLLEKLDQSAANDFAKEQLEGYELIRLPEDTTLCGFTPLMFAAPRDLAYSPASMDTETARSALRLQRLLFFGTAYLCGVDPPVLRLNFDGGVGEYVSAVNTAVSGKDGSEGGGSPPTPAELDTNNDVLLESFSGDDDAPDEGVADVDVNSITSNATTEIRDLLSRKVELEKTKRNEELHMQRVKKILSQSVVSVHIEVRPRYLVPDTNCFIDHLDVIRTIAQSTCYTLMVSIVVLSELEGLSRGGKAPAPDSRSALSPQHVKKVAESAKAALEFLKTRHASVKCVTTRGKILPSTTFSTEDDATWDDSFRNDDKILTTCLVLCKEPKGQHQDTVEGEPRHLIREVVLLTEDRNLRVKAYARDVPVRELPDFMRWAGLG